MSRLRLRFEQLVARGRDRGDAAVEFAINMVWIVPVAFVMLYAGQVALADLSVHAAAADAARSASISRTASEGSAAAQTTAAESIARQDLECVGVKVRADVGAFAAPPGTPGLVEVTVTCTLDTSGMFLPLPVTRDVSATATSPLDTYRERR